MHEASCPEEPGAGKLHAGICEGGAGQPASLPRHHGRARYEPAVSYVILSCHDSVSLVAASPALGPLRLNQGWSVDAVIPFPRCPSRPCAGTHPQGQPSLSGGINAKNAQESTISGAPEMASTTTCGVLSRPR